MCGSSNGARRDGSAAAARTEIALCLIIGLITSHRKHATMEVQGLCCNAAMIVISAMVNGNIIKSSSSSNSRGNFTATCDLNATDIRTRYTCILLLYEINVCV